MAASSSADKVGYARVSALDQQLDAARCAQPGRVCQDLFRAIMRVQRGLRIIHVLEKG
jgi:hypothetical protein